MSLRPGLLWLTLNLALITQCLSRNIIFFNFTYPVRCLLVPHKMFSCTPGWSPLIYSFRISKRLWMRGVLLNMQEPAGKPDLVTSILIKKSSGVPAESGRSSCGMYCWFWRLQNIMVTIRTISYNIKQNCTMFTTCIYVFIIILAINAVYLTKGRHFSRFVFLVRRRCFPWRRYNTDKSFT
jgi:hypothetical protein